MSCLFAAGLVIVNLIGWLSAQTSPASITKLPSSPIPFSPLEPSDWQVLEVLAGNRIKMLHKDQEMIVKLACILDKPDPTLARHATDRLRGLTHLGNPTFQVTELGLDTDGALLVELWISQYGNAPQLVQAILAGGSYVSVSPQADVLCPNAPRMVEAQRNAEKRHQSPRIIHF
ncbi:hypothetical protein [Synechocystis sp. LKSZ1]|uniref:hypothetical protein n=1 Tax=Synechocystis sp. LKSZ1 TaxID=3144951 RepID=UPI00336C1CD1